MGLLFYPRGGSAHVARNLAATLPQAGWDVTVLSGSVSLPGHPGDAAAFYRGLDGRPPRPPGRPRGFLPRARRRAGGHEGGAAGPGPEGRRPAAAPLLRGPAG